MPKKERMAQSAAAAGEKASKAAAAAAAAEDADWAEGGNAKKAAKAAADAAKAAEKARAKAEADRQLKMETEAAEKSKLRGAEKVAKRQTEKVAAFAKETKQSEAPVLVGRGIDAALAVMSIAESGAAGGGGGGGGGGEDDGGMAAEVERDVARAQKQMLAAGAGLVDPNDKHPERRMKAAYERFEEQEMKALREENPSLKRSQLLEVRGVRVAHARPSAIAARLNRRSLPFFFHCSCSRKCGTSRRRTRWWRRSA